MATKPFTLSADFPKAVRGYSMLAVDDFVRQMGGRLEALQATADEQTARAEQLADELRARFEKDPHVWTSSPKLLGVMLRRSADGSWPALRALLVKTLTAYDPPLAAQLSAS